jgi:Leucine-rich repeat (LRR) protein
MQVPSYPKRLDLSKGGLSRIPDSAIAFPAIEELMLGYNQLTNADNNLKLLHRYAERAFFRLTREWHEGLSAFRSPNDKLRRAGRNEAEAGLLKEQEQELFVDRWRRASN